MLEHVFANRDFILNKFNVKTIQTQTYFHATPHSTICIQEDIDQYVLWMENHDQVMISFLWYLVEI